MAGNLLSVENGRPDVVDSLSSLLSLLRGTSISAQDPGQVSYAAPLSAMADVYCVEEALKHSIFVHTLRLRGCQLGDGAAEALARALASNSVLQCLDLRDNNIHTLGATFLANALAQHNCTLQQLQLDGNPCSDDNVVAAINSALARNALASEPGINTAATTPMCTRGGMGMHSTPCVVRSNEVEDDRDDLALRVANLEGQQLQVAEHIDRLQMLLMQVQTWKVQVDLASNQLGMVLGLLEQEHASLRLRAEETHSWMEDVAGRCETTAQEVQALGHAARQQLQQHDVAIASLHADVQWLMAHSSRAAPLELAPLPHKARDASCLCSFPLHDLLGSTEDEDEAERVDGEPEVSAAPTCDKTLYSVLQQEVAHVVAGCEQRFASSVSRLEQEVAALKSKATKDTSDSDWTVGRGGDDVRLTPLLSRGSDAVAQLGKLSARVAALRDRLQQDE